MKPNFVRAALCLFLLMAVIAAAAVRVRGETAFEYGTAEGKAAACPDVRFAVLSDIHLYDCALGTCGSAFASCLASDEKLLPESGELLEAAVQKILTSGVQFVLVPGDLTKDGECSSHRRAAQILSRLTKAGIRVYVVPGNHDVDNPRAFRYAGSQTASVPCVTAAEFAEIYGGCGYADAILRDPNSLSYVVQPVKGLWIAALDTCRYCDNQPDGYETVGGRLTRAQTDWLTQVLERAQRTGNAVFVLAHHGLVEHWNGQRLLHPDYLVDHYAEIGRLLASWNVRLAFTGHYHAQDITTADFGTCGTLTDIETGALVTPPCPVRFCTIVRGILHVSTVTLAQSVLSAEAFPEAGAEFVRKNFTEEVREDLKKYRLSDADAAVLAKSTAAALIAHDNGDEDPSRRRLPELETLSPYGKLAYETVLKRIDDGLWQDLPPADNNCTLNLN
jgi:Predicted phosphohydrolases